MHRRSFLKMLTGSGAILIGASISGCVVHSEPPHKQRPVHVERDYDYYYYPNVNVYFHISSGFYYYWHRDIWVRARNLPRQYHLNHGHRKRLRIRDRHPYTRNHEHRREHRREDSRDRRDDHRDRRKDRRDDHRDRRDDRRDTHRR